MEDFEPPVVPLLATATAVGSARGAGWFKGLGSFRVEGFRFRGLEFLV